MMDKQVGNRTQNFRTPVFAYKVDIMNRFRTKLFKDGENKQKPIIKVLG